MISYGLSVIFSCRPASNKVHYGLNFGWDQPFFGEAICTYWSISTQANAVAAHCPRCESTPSPMWSLTMPRSELMNTLQSPVKTPSCQPLQYRNFEHHVQNYLYRFIGISWAWGGFMMLRLATPACVPGHPRFLYIYIWYIAVRVCLYMG